MRVVCNVQVDATLCPHLYPQVMLLDTCNYFTACCRFARDLSLRQGVAKAPEGWTHSKTWRVLQSPSKRRQLLECGSPLPALSLSNVPLWPPSLIRMGGLHSLRGFVGQDVPTCLAT